MLIGNLGSRKSSRSRSRRSSKQEESETQNSSLSLNSQPQEVQSVENFDRQAASRESLG